jgi:flagellar biosynthesis protein FlhB
MAEDLGEKSEQATPKRLQEAREEGNIAKSADLAGAVKLAAMTTLIGFTGVALTQGLQRVLENSLGAVAQGGPETAYDEAVSLFGSIGRSTAPILIVAWVVSYLSYFLQIGWLLTTKPMQPDIGRLHPMKGFRRLFGAAALAKTGMDVLKLATVLSVATIVALGMAPQIVTLPLLEPLQNLGAVGGMVFRLAMTIVVLLLILGVADFLYQKWKYSRDMRMSKQEVKEEFRQSEGDPEVKRRRMRMQQQMAMQRLSSSVPKADVIVTNPEHLSIAIAYKPGEMNAPRVVAKGADFVAIRIRQIALQHGIPILERKPLARALYKDVQVGQEIPESFYKAVAEILAYVYRLKGKAA